MLHRTRTCGNTKNQKHLNQMMRDILSKCAPTCETQNLPCNFHQQTSPTNSECPSGSPITHWNGFCAFGVRSTSRALGATRTRSQFDASPHSWPPRNHRGHCNVNGCTASNVSVVSTRPSVISIPTSTTLTFKTVHGKYICSTGSVCSTLHV